MNTAGGWAVSRSSEVPVPEFSPEDEVDTVMTNFDLSIRDGAEEELRAGQWGRHAAWEFNGVVWYSAPDGLFYEQVWRYHVPQAIYGAGSLKALMTLVNAEWGAE